MKNKVTEDIIPVIVTLIGFVVAVYLISGI